MSTRTASTEQLLRSARQHHHDRAAIETIVPVDSKRVVLTSSKSRGSDWDVSAVDDVDRRHETSEDSGLQVDVSKSTTDESFDAMTLTTKKVFAV